MNFAASKIGSCITSIWAARFFQAMVDSWMLPSTMPPACRKPKGSGDVEVVSCCFKAATINLKTEVWKNTMNENLNPTGTWTYLPNHGRIHCYKPATSLSERLVFTTVFRRKTSLRLVWPGILIDSDRAVRVGILIRVDTELYTVWLEGCRMSLFSSGYMRIWGTCLIENILVFSSDKESSGI